MHRLGECPCAHCSLTGVEKHDLEQVRARITDEDRASAEIRDVDADGMIFSRQASVDEQVMYLIAKWIWDEAVEGEE